MTAARLLAGPESQEGYRSDPDGLPNSRVRVITQTPDGYLWIGASGGLVRYHYRQFRGTAAMKG